ncbi:MAG: hypothetical protein KC431_18050 [Myxococcales bacterium]|nr:hypothetical protein [Myxococcales bacterium]
MHPRRSPTLALALALVLPALAGCDFFKELQSEPGAEAGDTDTDTDTGDSDTGDEPCTNLDDYCADQDTLRTCDPESGALVTLDCASLCGASSQLNFSCIPAEDIHACWCVTPGQYKLKSCSELEQCVVACGDPGSDCSQNCFTDTTYQTVRLLGSLYHCADTSCDDICKEFPSDCGSCMQAALAGVWGDCGLERSVCDADQNDEPTWP